MDRLTHDLDRRSGNASLLRYFTNRALTEIDWQIVEALGDEPKRLPALIQELDIIRQVAVVHTMSAIADSYGDEREDERDFYLKHVKLPADLALRVAETWEEVEEAKERWHALGISLKHEDVDSLAEFAERAIS